MSQSNTGAGYDEFTPVPLTAEALAQLASQDHGLGNVARMMDNGVWNTDGVQDDIRRESIDRDVDRYHRTLDMGERVPRNSRRSEDAQPRISCNSNLSGFDAVGGGFIAHLAPRYGSSSFTSRATSLAMNAIATELDCTEVRAVSTRGSVAHKQGVRLSTPMSYPPFSSVTWTTSWTSRGNATCPRNLVRGAGLPPVQRLRRGVPGPAAGLLRLLHSRRGIGDCVCRRRRARVHPSVQGSVEGRRGIHRAHPGGSGSSAIKLSTLGEMSKIPAGSYVHGNGTSTHTSTRGINLPSER